VPQWSAKRLAVSAAALVVALLALATLLVVLVGLACTADSSSIAAGSAADTYCSYVEGRRSPLLLVFVLYVPVAIAVIAGAVHANHARRFKPLWGTTGAALGWIVMLFVIWLVLPRD
jgi:hypothetical protein